MDKKRLKKDRSWTEMTNIRSFFVVSYANNEGEQNEREEKSHERIEKTLGSKYGAVL